MMFFLRPLLGFLVLVLITPALHAQSVEGVRVGEHDDKTRIVFEVQPGTRYSISTASNPPRLLVEFPGASWKGTSLELPDKSGLVAGIQQEAAKPDGRLFTLAMKQGAQVRDAFVLPAQEGKPARLVIDVVAYRPGGDTVASAPPEKPEEKPEPRPEPVKNTPPPPAKQGLSKPLIVLDPGHGGKDPGAIGPSLKTYEKNVVLQLSKELRDALVATGRYRVKLTRETDIFIPLAERPAIAQKLQADLFLSVHADAAHNRKAFGASIYTLSKTASDRVAARLAAKENRSDQIAGVKLETNVDNITKSVLLDLMQRDTMNMSSLFAEITAEQLGKRIRTRNKPHGYAGFMVLLAPDVPSALLESGFLSNAEEEKLLSQRSHRQKIITSVIASIDEYFQRTRHVASP